VQRARRRAGGQHGDPVSIAPVRHG
jgi:hypothetical protein